jgi:hypothetical protein
VQVKVNAKMVYVNANLVSVEMHVMFMIVNLLQMANHAQGMDSVMRKVHVYAIQAGLMLSVPLAYAHWVLATKYAVAVVYAKSLLVSATMNFSVMRVN